MVIANAAIVPAEKSSGPMFQLTAMPTSPIKDKVVEKGSTEEGVEKQAQTYMERIRNYIPVEVIGFFIFCNALVTQDSGKVADEFVAVASVVVALVAVVIFTKMANAKASTEIWAVQSFVSGIAFLVWAYAINAEAFTVLHWPQSPVISGFLLATFTLFSGLVVPVKRKSKPAKA